MIANSLGGRIKRTRMAAGLQGKDLAMMLGISRPYLTQIEKGVRHPAHELLTRLANELKVTPHWLLQGSHPTAQQAPEITDADTRIAALESQLAIANDTINNLSKALAQGRTFAPPAPAPPASGARYNTRTNKLA